MTAINIVGKVSSAFIGYYAHIFERSIDCSIPTSHNEDIV